ncbi:MAG: glycosyltransferase [Deltaproteobacteria bacterium]|nr:glycosyltransferase [Deltaproteobacteria bacterium]
MRGGHEVTVLAPHAPEVASQWDDGGVEVQTFRYAPERFELLGYSRSLERDETMKKGAAVVAPLYAWQGRRAARALLRSRSFDLMQAHWVVPNALVAAPLARRVPMAVGLHGSDVFLAEKPWLRSFVKRALDHTSVLTGCSPELVDRVCAVGFPAERSRVIPYGVDTEVFYPDRSQGEGWRKRLGIPSQAPMILSVGRMATKKGYQFLMPVLERLFSAHPEAHLVLAGGGDRLAEFQAAAAPWRDQVHFPGAVYRDTLPDLYRAADLFVLPAVHDPKGNVDGLPNVILEAMASGLPVVASEISGIPLAVAPEETGLLVPEQNSEQLLAALSRALDLPTEVRRQWGTRARKRTETELNWDAIAVRYRQAYELALGDRKDG